MNCGCPQWRPPQQDTILFLTHPPPLLYWGFLGSLTRSILWTNIHTSGSRQDRSFRTRALNKPPCGMFSTHRIPSRFHNLLQKSCPEGQSRGRERAGGHCLPCQHLLRLSWTHRLPHGHPLSDLTGEEGVIPPMGCSDLGGHS